MDDISELLFEAASHGDTAQVQRLIPLYNFTGKVDAALQVAAAKGYTECVRLILPISNPKFDDSRALIYAAGEGHVECVKLLIPVSNCKALDSKALYRALQNYHTDCINLLFDVSDVHLVLHNLQRHYPNDPKYWNYLENKIAQQQRDILNGKISQDVAYTCKKARKI